MVPRSEIRLRALKVRRSLEVLLIVIAMSAMCAGQGAIAPRKIRTKVVPAYPELARRLNLVATVKVQVTVAPSGVVLQAKVLGGHPLLVDPSLDAAKHWRYEPAGETTTTVIEFHFSPGTD